jgi:hypothetical protein
MTPVNRSDNADDPFPARASPPLTPADPSMSPQRDDDDGCDERASDAA